VSAKCRSPTTMTRPLSNGALKRLGYGGIFELGGSRVLNQKFHKIPRYLADCGKEAYSTHDSRILALIMRINICCSPRYQPRHSRVRSSAPGFDRDPIGTIVLTS
jgi:hypothetical protein